MVICSAQYAKRESHREKQKPCYLAFLNLDKAYDELFSAVL